MYAVIENGGKQYRVELGAELEFDLLSADPGETIDVGRVLLVADGDDTLIGQPTVEGARVTGEVVRPTRGEKLIVFKYRPKARRRVKHGHRADLTLVRIADIEWAGRSAAREAQAQAEEEQVARAEAANAAEAKAKADRALADKLAKDTAADTKADKAATAAKADTKAAKATKADTKTTKADTKTTKADKSTATATKPARKPTTAKAKTTEPAKSAAEPKSRTRAKKEE
jgi:large subunit ribosomal protein L21